MFVYTMKNNIWGKKDYLPSLKGIPNFIMAAIIRFAFQIRFKNAFHCYQKQNMPDKYKREPMNTFFRNKKYFSEMKILTLVKWLGKELLKVCTQQYKGATSYNGRTQR